MPNGGCVYQCVHSIGYADVNMHSIHTLMWDMYMLTYTVHKLCRLCVHVNVHSTYIHVGYVYANVHCTHNNVGCIYINNNNNNKLMGVFYGAHIQPKAAYSALHHNIHGHWTCWFRSCTILIPRGAYSTAAMWR